MKHPHPHILGLLVAGALVATGTTAFAAPTSAPVRKSAPQGVAITWTTGTPVPFAATRWDGAWVKSLNRVYFTGFRAADNSTDGSVWYYDIGSDTYVDTGVDMPVPISNYEIAQLQDSTGLALYLFGGRDNNGIIIDTVQAYYPLTNTTATFPLDPLPTRTPSDCVALPAMGVVTLGNKAYVLGGASFSSGGCIDDNSAQTWTFDPMGPAGARWTQGPDLNLARGYITGAVLGNTIYAVGGDINIAGSLFPQSIVESWNIHSGSWNDAGVADLPIPCDESQAFERVGPLAKGFVLSTCGEWPAALSDTYFYDERSNTWSFVGAVNEARRNQSGTFIMQNGVRTMFIAGGYAADGFTALASTEFGTGVGGVAGPGRAGPATTGGAPPTN